MLWFKSASAVYQVDWKIATKSTLCGDYAVGYEQNINQHLSFLDLY